MNELILRRYDIADFDTLNAWWGSHGFQMVPAMLPEVGYVVEGVCAGFLYKTDSVYCLIEWIVSNPVADKESRRKGVAMVIDAVIAEARELGFKVMHTTTAHKGLIERYKEQGFVPSDTGMTALVRGL